MTAQRVYTKNRNNLFYASFIIYFMMNAMFINAQTPTDFSGNWLFDKSISSPEMLESTYPGTVVLKIEQNAGTISFSDTWSNPGSDDWTTAVESYNLDGKEKITKHEVGTNKNSAKWSKDKKLLTITNLDTQKLKGVMQDFLVVDTYSLSENGQTLTIERYSKNPVKGEGNGKKIYHRK
jgi:hypothetical protein